MPSKNKVLFEPFFLLLLLFILFINPSSAQIKKGVNPKHRSFYFSAGYNREKYFNSTIKVDQPSLDNNYSLEKVKADYLTNVKALFPWQLNYRLGYYFNYDQTCGFEINYDPVNYHITDGENVVLKGTLNGVPNITQTIPFYAKNGYYYGLDGANLILLNFVRRFTIYRPNSNKVAVDAIAKAGAGPVMPHFLSSLPVNGTMPLTTFDDPQLQLKGWNAATEAALRITIYRYGYIEIAGKYDYAMYNDLKLYEGTAKQNISTLEVIASVGFTLPSNRYNPLFHHEKNIITILPFFQNKKLQDSLDKAEMKQAKDDAAGVEQMQDLPEFGDIVDKRTRRENRRIADSIDKQQMADKVISDSIANKAMIDSIANQGITDSISNKRMIDSLANKATADSITASMPIDSTVNKTPADTTKHEETKKERKARLKKEKEAQKEQEQKAKEQAQQAPEQPQPPVVPPDNTGNKDAQDKKENVENNGEDKKAQEQKDKEQKEQDQKAQEQKDKEKKEQDKQAEKDKKAADKQAKKDKKAQEKKDKKEQKEKEKKEKEELKEKEKKDKEQAEKDKEDKDKQGGN